MCVLLVQIRDKNRAIDALTKHLAYRAEAHRALANAVFDNDDITTNIGWLILADVRMPLAAVAYDLPETSKKRLFSQAKQSCALFDHGALTGFPQRVNRKYRLDWTTDETIEQSALTYFRDIGVKTDIASCPSAISIPLENE